MGLAYSSGVVGIMTVHAPDLVIPKLAPHIKRLESYLRENVGVDPAIIADELGLQEFTVRTMQRKLGLRNCTYAPRKADRNI